jgi:H+/Cl- antiporter ClcA
LALQPLLKTSSCCACAQAAFGAPIGGVLFSMEEACSLWTRKVAWRCFVAAIVAAFTISVCSKHGDAGFIMFTSVHTLAVDEMLHQLPFMAAVAALGGAIGAVFNSLRRALWPLRAAKSKRGLRVAEAIAVLVLCICVKFWLSTFAGTCVDTPHIWVERSFEVRLCPESGCLCVWHAPRMQRSDIDAASRCPTLLLALRAQVGTHAASLLALRLTLNTATLACSQSNGCAQRASTMTSPPRSTAPVTASSRANSRSANTAALLPTTTCPA